MTTMHGAEASSCRALSRGRLHLTRGASAPAILFVHGGFHGAWCWSKTLAHLSARGVGAAAVDLRGHGGLEQDASFITQGLSDMGDDVAEAAQHLPKSIFLAGHSLGALVAMRAAARSEARGLILLAPAGVVPGHSLPQFPADRAVHPPGEERARKWFMSGATAAGMSDYLSQLCPESPKFLNDCFHAGVAIEPDEIRCPVLCLSGGKDDSPLHPGGQDQIVAARYGAELHVISQAGHCLMLDDGWREAADAIQTWVTRTVT